MSKLNNMRAQYSPRQTTAEDAIRRAEAFPVKGGDIVPIQRKSWFKTVQQRHPLPKTA